MARITIAQAGDTETVVVTPEFESVGGDHTLPEGTLLEGTLANADEHHTEVFPPFDSTTFASQILWLAISFAALYFIMSRVALPRIGTVLEERRDRIEGDLAEADRLRKKTDDAIASYETALAEARSKAHVIAEQARAESKARIDTERQRIEDGLSKKVAEAEDRIAGTKAKALDHVGEIASDTAQAVVAQLLGKVSIADARKAVATVGKE